MIFKGANQIRHLKKWKRLSKRFITEIERSLLDYLKFGSRYALIFLNYLLHKSLIIECIALSVAKNIINKKNETLAVLF
jgi:hypothetical protein